MLKVSARRLLIYGAFLVIAGTYVIRSFQMPSTLSAGDRAPTFEATLSTGKRLDLSEPPGHVVVLTFWASWCEPCRSEAPILNSLQTQAQIVGISVDDADADAAALLARGIGIRFPVIGGRPDLPQLFDLQSVPATFVIAPDGKLAYVHVGVTGREELEDAIKKATARSI